MQLTYLNFALKHADTKHFKHESIPKQTPHLEILGAENDRAGTYG
jgi:hypothetical protein